MEAVARKLRSGRSCGLGTPVVLTCDNEEQHGAVEFLLQVLRDFIQAQAQGRCEAQSIWFVSCKTSPALLSRWLENASIQSVSLLDYFTDPWGWFSGDQVQSSAWGCEATTISKGPDTLQQICDTVLTAGLPACVVIDDLSALLSRHSLPQLVSAPLPHTRCPSVGGRWLSSQVLSMLETLCCSSSVSCILSSVHKDLHELFELEALLHLASCLIEVESLTAFQQEVLSRHLVHVPQGQAHFTSKRQQGRLASQTKLFGVIEPVQVVMWDPPDGIDWGSAALVETASAARAAGVDTSDKSRPAAAPLTSMKLDLTAEERAAKESVVLPYERRGDGQNVGSAVEAAQKLGEILYVRDSEEEHDSDEDPDDDLDF